MSKGRKNYHVSAKETRAYVAAILTYALIYQSRLQSGEVRINDFMRDIKTRNKLATSE
jgi:hypothetical protein